MATQSYHCDRKCCSILINAYGSDPPNRIYRQTRKKAGMFIYDPIASRVLLVQSRGKLWGPPKGSIEEGEDDVKCAIREVKEETGLDIDVSDFNSTEPVISGHATFFYIETAHSDISVRNEVKDNDANGISWIRIECLIDLVRDGKITLNYHGKFLLRHYLNMPKYDFTEIKRKHRL
jgi:8-oxo-dGTP pyrophosphatase MutT (NUDIX family)